MGKKSETGTILYEPPKVTVVVAAYNVSKYLPKCLDSISVQTYTNLEIIVIDDGSKDITKELCDIYGKKEPRAKIIHQKNQGLSAVRNRGIDEATGKYIIFVDGDDYLNPQFVEVMTQNVELKPADVAVCGFSTVPDGPAEIPEDELLSGEDAAIKLLTQQENYQIIACNKIYKRTLFRDIRFPVGKKHEDNLTTYKLLATAKQVCFVSEVLYNYVQRDDSIMKTNNIDSRLLMKLIASHEAKRYFKNSPRLLDAAKISELLAHYQFIDNIVAKRSKANLAKHLNWVKKNKNTLMKNPFITKKLKTYLKLSTFANGIIYKLFRKVKN